VSPERRPTIRGGDPSCVHWVVFGRPTQVKGTKLTREHGVCKKCGADQEFLRSAYPDWRGEDYAPATDLSAVKEIIHEREPDE